MKFSYSVISDNTQENREWLEKVGYVIDSEYIPNNPTLIYTNGNVYALANASQVERFTYMSRINSINCIGNPQLFQAVSAMRDDSDYGQLFECKDGLFICQYETSREHIDKECKGWDIINLKKLNLEELQERFKEKER